MGKEETGAKGLPRLCIMMFLNYFGLGAWIVSVSRYLPTSPQNGGLGFEPSEVSLIFAATPLAGMITPLLVAPLADKYFSAEKLFGYLHLFMALMLGLLGLWCSQHEAIGNPWPMFVLMLLYAAALMPTLTLSNVIAMRNLENPGAMFSRVRLVGTFGWILSGYVVSWVIVAVSPQPFYLAAGTSLILGLFAFQLPSTPPLGRSRSMRDLVGLSALEMFRDRAFIAFALATLIGNMLNQFYVINANRYLDSSGISRPEAVLTIAQWCEMTCMALVPIVVKNFGMRVVLMAGLLGWFSRNLILTVAPIELAVAFAVPLHGLSYTFFSIVGAMFVDREAPPHLRASAQALLTFLSSGPAVLTGYWLTSVTGQHYLKPEAMNWVGVWTVPTLGVLVALGIFAVLFREPPKSQSD